LPPLVPVRITITQDGTPLADAAVTLINNDTSLSRWVVGGRTDASGVCNVCTQGKYSGAPHGSFKVLVRKEESEIVNDEQNFYDVVEEKYKTVLTTDLTLEVPNSGATQTFDVGKAIKKAIILAH
jgi:5-hydroxyisourate hydrolase-like protein (transthyretin family)